MTGLNHISEFAPAKVNLALHVTGQRADGYHLLHTLVCFCDVGDQLEIALASPAADNDFLNISGPFATKLQADENNLVIRAIRLLRETARSAGHSCPYVDIRLVKNLPVAAGIGGGSANAAAVLRALQRLWQLPATHDVSSVAIQLGADVPMCMLGRPLIASGIGDELTPLTNMPAMHLVLVNSGLSVATPAVFSALVGKTNAPMPVDPENLDICQIAQLRNDLEEPAISLSGSVAEVIRALRTLDRARFCRMTGSGATCFAVFDTQANAREAAQRLKADFPNWWIRATTTIPASEDEADYVPN